MNGDNLCFPLWTGY